MNSLYELRDSVAVVWLNSPPDSKVNILNLEVLDLIRQNVKSVHENPLIRALILISSKPGNFIAGADVNILSTFNCLEEVIKMSREAQEVTFLSDTFTKPLVAAVCGACVGGGVEALLGTHYNIAVNNRKTTFMLPEVLIGLLPGAGGTQRLPRKVPLLEALPMLLMGKEISAAKAFEIGLIDELVEPIDTEDDKDETKLREKLLKVALNAANKLADGTLQGNKKQSTKLRRAQKYILELKFVRNMILNKAKSKIESLSYGLYPAPLEIVEVLRATLGIEDKRTGFEIESAGFGKLAMTKQHKALLGLFFGQTYCKKSHLGEPDQKAKNLVVMGAGWISAGIALVSLLKGLHVTIKETDRDNLASGIQQLKKGFARKKITGEKKELEPDTILGRHGVTKNLHSYMTQLDTTFYYDDLNQADMIIESVSENVSIKRKLLKECERVLPGHCVYAISSWITPISQIANESSRKEMIVGINYMAPVEKMKIVEVIKTEESSANAVATAINVALRQSKMVIVVRDKPGFFITRVLTATILEAIRILQEWTVDAQTLDTLTKKLGFVVGVVSMADGMGLDVVVKNTKHLESAYGERFAGSCTDLLMDMVANGMCGKKSEQGFFVYSTNKKDKTVNKAAMEILKNHRSVNKNSSTTQEIQDRILLRFTNEAILCLQEGVIESPLEGDIGSVFGLGFPPCLGGPFRWTDMSGAANIVDKMQSLEEKCSTFAPCTMLLEHAKDHEKKFHNYGTFVI